MTPRLIATILLLAPLAAAPAARAVETSLPASTTPTFTWGHFGTGLLISNITVQGYNTPSGAPGGSVATLDMPVYAVDPDPLAGDPTVPCGAGTCEQIGIMTFQYVLWRGSVSGLYGPTNRFGAAVLGGFKLTDATEMGTNFSFLQTYTDASSSTPVIDGGGASGKVNAQIPRYVADPNAIAAGWRFGGTDYQYSFFDVPFDWLGVSPAETVSFETALVATDATGTNQQILEDFTWSFTTDLTGGVLAKLTGTPPTPQPPSPSPPTNSSACTPTPTPATPTPTSPPA